VIGGISKDLRPIVRTAEDAGWTVIKRKGGHLKWISPDGQITGSGATLSDQRAISNIKSRLRRLGLAV
jgi:hypothetical protein